MGLTKGHAHVSHTLHTPPRTRRAACPHAPARLNVLRGRYHPTTRLSRLRRETILTSMAPAAWAGTRVFYRSVCFDVLTTPASSKQAWWVRCVALAASSLKEGGAAAHKLHVRQFFPRHRPLEIGHRPSFRGNSTYRRGLPWCSPGWVSSH